MNNVYEEPAIPLADIFSRQEIEDISEQLLESETDAKKLEIIEGFLVSKIVNDYPAVFGKVVEFIHASKGFHNITYISRLFNVSERTLNRYFNKYIGVSPIAYLNLIRFRSVISLSNNTDVEIKLLSHAFEVGYYDQSHFIKHFKEFSSLTPSRFFSSRKASNVYDFYNT